MVGDRTLSVPVLLNGLGDLFASLAFVGKDTHAEYLIKRRPVGKTLTLGYLGDVLVFSYMLGEALDKSVFTEYDLALHLIPDGSLPYSQLHKLPIFFLCRASRSTELPKYPIRDEAGRRLFKSCSCAVARPRPVIGFFYHAGANGIQDNVAANFQKMRVLLYQDGLIPALEDMPGLVVALVARLCINAV